MIAKIRQSLGVVGGPKVFLGILAIAWGFQLINQASDERNEVLEAQRELIEKEELRLAQLRAAADIADDRLNDALRAASRAEDEQSIVLARTDDYAGAEGFLKAHAREDVDPLGRGESDGAL